MGIPTFGLGIPVLVDLYAGLSPSSAAVRWGAAWFLLLAWAVWHGNRWLLFRNMTTDWLTHPARRVVRLLGGIVLFTVPLTGMALVAFFMAAGLPVDAAKVRTVMLMNVICVVFVAHVYETVLLVKQRAEDLTRVERLERARLQAELEGLKAQVDPHFIFNCLNTLAALVVENPERAAHFTRQLAAVTRHLTRAGQSVLVPLSEELDFVQRYADLLAIRFGDGVVVRLGPVAGEERLVPPASLQMLVENAVKHNAFTVDHPLVVHVTAQEDSVTVEHVRRARREPVAPGGVGLRNLSERSRLACGRVVQVHQDANLFRVCVPTVAATGGGP